MKWLLVLVPIAIALEHFAPGNDLLVFAVAAGGIVPLASIMAQATGSLATRLGPGLGGLLNATFGNAAELIIALAALRAGRNGSRSRLPLRHAVRAGFLSGSLDCLNPVQHAGPQPLNPDAAHE